MRIPLKTQEIKKFYSRSIKWVTFGSETLSHLSPKIWELVPVGIKNVDSVASFKRAIKEWKPITVLAVYAGRIFFFCFYQKDH